MFQERRLPWLAVRQYKLPSPTGPCALSGVFFLIHVKRLERLQSIATTSFHGGHALPGHFVAGTRAAAVVSYTIGRIGAGSALAIQVGISSAQRLNFLTLRKVRAVIARLIRGQSANGQEVSVTCGRHRCVCVHDGVVKFISHFAKLRPPYRKNIEYLPFYLHHSITGKKRISKVNKAVFIISPYYLTLTGLTCDAPKCPAGNQKSKVSIIYPQSA